MRRKTIREMHGRPLVAYSIETALAREEHEADVGPKALMYPRRAPHPGHIAP